MLYLVPVQVETGCCSGWSGIVPPCPMERVYGVSWRHQGDCMDVDPLRIRLLCV